MINDYTKHNYNGFLDRDIKPKNTSALSFDSQFEGFDWSKGQGGKISLGGPSDGLGTIYVLDSTGKKKLIIDSNGLTIVGNNIIVEDANGVKTNHTLA